MPRRSRSSATCYSSSWRRRRQRRLARVRVPRSCVHSELGRPPAGGPVASLAGSSRVSGCEGTNALHAALQSLLESSSWLGARDQPPSPAPPRRRRLLRGAAPAAPGAGGRRDQPAAGGAGAGPAAAGEVGAQGDSGCSRGPAQRHAGRSARRGAQPSRLTPWPHCLARAAGGCGGQARRRGGAGAAGGGGGARAGERAGGAGPGGAHAEAGAAQPAAREQRHAAVGPRLRLPRLAACSGGRLLG